MFSHTTRKSKGTLSFDTKTLTLQISHLNQDCLCSWHEVLQVNWNILFLTFIGNRSVQYTRRLKIHSFKYRFSCLYNIPEFFHTVQMERVNDFCLYACKNPSDTTTWCIRLSIVWKCHEWLHCLKKNHKHCSATYIWVSRNEHLFVKPVWLNRKLQTQLAQCWILCAHHTKMDGINAV